MFTQLQALLKNCSTLTVILAGNSDNTLSVTVLPKSKLTGEDANALSTPLCLTATAAELDAEFVTVLSQYVDAHVSLNEQLATTKTILDAANKEAQGKATKAISKASTSAPKKSSTATATPSDDEETVVDIDDENADGTDGADGDTSDDTTTSTNQGSETAIPAGAGNLWE